VCGLVHERCSAHQKGTGLPCGRWPKGAARACRSHGGGAGQVEEAGRRRAEEQRVAGEVADLLDRYDEPGTSTSERLLAVVRRTGAMVAVWEHLVRGLELHPQVIEEVVGDGLGIGGQTGTVHVTANQALYGRNHLGDGAAHIVVEEYRHWLVEHARVCKLALDADVEERRVQVVEDQARLLAQVLSGASAALLAMALDVIGSAADRGRLEAVWGERWPGIARAQLEAITTEGNAA
jgi:hypothetical protein